MTYKKGDRVKLNGNYLILAYIGREGIVIGQRPPFLEVAVTGHAASILLYSSELDLMDTGSAKP